MTKAPARKKPKLNHGRVRRVERITPHMIRVVIGDPELPRPTVSPQPTCPDRPPGLAGFSAGEYTDQYVKLLFPAPGVVYPQPFDLEAVRRDLPRAQWPRLRSYTVRSWDPDALELAIDFVHHGDKGIAGPWAARVRPGEEIFFLGPGGAYAPSTEADWHLLAGDESALPAIAAALERLPAGAPARVFVEVTGPDEEQRLSTPADAEIVWLHRHGRRVGELLVPAVRDLEFPPGEVHAFVHGEAGFVRQLRRQLRIDRGLPLDRLSISGYWRLGSDDEGWRAAKADWNRDVAEEEARAAI